VIRRVSLSFSVLSSLRVLAFFFFGEGGFCISVLSVGVDVEGMFGGLFFSLVVVACAGR
jgi:hypothetical protein